MCGKTWLDKRGTALYNFAVRHQPRRYGGIGRHKGLKILRKKFRIGSSPISGTMLSPGIRSRGILHAG